MPGPPTITVISAEYPATALSSLRVHFMIDDHPEATGVRYWYRVALTEVDGGLDTMSFYYRARDERRLDFAWDTTNTGRESVRDDLLIMVEHTGSVLAGRHHIDIPLDGTGLGTYTDADEPERLRVIVLVRRDNDPWWLYHNLDFVYTSNFQQVDFEVSVDWPSDPM